jgi:uncharacterized protein (TIGR03067 family)
MPPVPLEQFVRHLEESGVLASETLRDFIPPSAAPKDSEELARELVRQKKLTKFQAGEAYKGKAKSLVLGNYTLLDKIGAGGMGQVFKAEHRRMKRIVAVKMLPTAMMKNPAVVARFEREVTAAARLNHPNIVTAFDADNVNGVHLLIMEYVEGSDLSAIVKKDGPLPLDQAVNYILQTAQGLQAAHAEGIVHRDIKPANLLLDKKGTVKILDMGLARVGGSAPGQADLTSTGAVMGTVDYMAPEQALNTKSADARADIYSLGCSLFYLLTGKAAYGGDSLMAKLLAHRDEPIPSLRALRPDVSDQLEEIFFRMVAKGVEERYQTVSEVIADLMRLTTGHQPAVAAQSSSGSFADSGLTDFLRDAALAPAPPVRPAKRPKVKVDKEWIRKNKRPLSIGGGVLGAVILLAGIVISLQSNDGTLVVTVNEPDAELRVLNAEGKVEITRQGDKGPLTISVVPGKHQLQVQKEGFELFTDKFEIKSKGTESITAKLVPTKKTAVTEKARAKWPDTAVAFGSKRFALYTEQLSWHAARQRCVELGGRLAEVRSQAENDFLERMVVNREPDGVWLGATDEVQEGRWLWSEGSPLTYANWDNTQPNNAGPSGEHYLMLLVTIHTGKWWDQPAKSGYGLPGGWKAGYICEWDASPQETDVKPAVSAKSAAGPEGVWKSISEEVNGKAWDSQVVRDGKRHVTFQDNSFTMFREYLGKPGTYSGKYQLLPDGKSFDFSGTGPGGNHVDFRGIYEVSGDTLRLSYKYTADSAIRPAAFKTEPGGPISVLLVLKRASADGPPQDAAIFNGHAYKFYPNVLTWHEAKSRCEKLGGHLPIIDSDAENRFVNELARKKIAYLADMDGVWLGATDEQKEGDWKWIDGKPLAFTKWGPGQPNNKQNEEHYLMLFLAKEEWSDQPDRSSQHKTYFVCEWDTAIASAGANAGPGAAFHDPAFQKWELATKLLPEKKQIEAVVKKLKELNKNFDGKVTPQNATDNSLNLTVVVDFVTDISPVRALTNLKTLHCGRTAPGPFNDLSPLRGLSLTAVSFPGSDIEDLSPLTGMPLTFLEIGGTQVTDLSPLNGKPIQWLSIHDTSVASLEALREMPLGTLNLHDTEVADLSPLAGMPLFSLNFWNTQVTDVSPLAGMKLTVLGFTPAKVSRGIDTLRKMSSLQKIGVDGSGVTYAPDEFWKKYDAGEFGTPASK